MINDVIELKGIIFEDFVNYKKPSMTLMFPICKGFKCGVDLCQNSELAATPSQTVSVNSLMESYVNNPITEAIIFQGLEPLDSLIACYTVAAALNRFNINDDIIIYTGYDKSEVSKQTINDLIEFIPGDFIIKWGRYIPNQSPHYDSVLGVMLASDNQYGEYIKYGNK